MPKNPKGKGAKLRGECNRFAYFILSVFRKFSRVSCFEIRIFPAYPSAVVGSMMPFTSETRLAGNPPCFACSRTISSFGAM
jgi:hypothetical protein